MFYSAVNKQAFTPNPSHLHRTTATTVTTLPPSQIPRKVSVGKLEITGTDVAIEKSVVNTFLQSVNANSPARNSSHLYKTQHTLKLSEPIAGNGGESRVRALSSEFNKNSIDACDKPAVVMRPKNTEEKRRMFGEATRREAINTVPDESWKGKYEEAEKKRKEWLSESQKLAREKANLEQQLKRLEDEHQKLQSDYLDKTQQLNQLRRVSEQVYQDYDKLNSKYETETTTLHKALEIASQWYKENKKLKRESIALRSSLMPLSTLERIQDEIDGEDAQSQDELEELRKTVQELSNEVGQLKSELNRARLLEFEAQEQFINLSQSLDEERKAKAKLEEELQELRMLKEKFESVTYMVHDEMRALRTERDRATEAASRLQAEAQQAKKERNVLAHQSSLLMEEISSNETLLKVLLEVEDLKRKLEEETQNHAADVQRLQEKLDFKDAEGQVEVLEEKLRLAENELQVAIKKAQQAEQSALLLKEKVAELELKVESANIMQAPPQPPPPPPLPDFSIHTSRKNIISREKSMTNGEDSLKDMANILGIQRTPKINNVAGGAIHDIINEIKGGKFTLKATERQKMKKEEPPAAVQEMLNIIGTLKRRPGRISQADINESLSPRQVRPSKPWILPYVVKMLSECDSRKIQGLNW